ncbi:MAG: helix-turn-helix transcriptional regulator [Acidimicrobiales bacterium]
MAKLERLLNLTAALLETERPLRAEEIRQRIDGYPPADQSFHRAFERDKDDLREMGIPISVLTVPGTDPPIDGYRIHKEDYYLRDPGLAPDELAALHLASNNIKLEGLGGAEALRKLGGSVASSTNQPLASVPTDPRLTPLFTAVTERRVVEFGYRGEPREVEPWRLDFVRGRWYLTGFDRSRRGERHFRLDRVDADITLGSPAGFERAAGGSGVRLQPWELGDEPPRTARLLVDPDQAAFAVHHIGEAVQTNDDGSIVIEIAVTNEQAFISFVLSFLDHAEILEPVELRESMTSWLATVAGASG